MPCFIGNILRIVWMERSRCCKYNIVFLVTPSKVLYTESLQSKVLQYEGFKIQSQDKALSVAKRPQSYSTINYRINLWCPSMCHTSFGPAQVYILCLTPRATVARFITPRKSTLQRDDLTLSRVFHCHTRTIPRGIPAMTTSILTDIHIHTYNQIDLVTEFLQHSSHLIEIQFLIMPCIILASQHWVELPCIVFAPQY